MAYSRAPPLLPLWAFVTCSRMNFTFTFTFNDGLLVFLKLQVLGDANMHNAHSDIFAASHPNSNVEPQAFVLEVSCSNTVMNTGLTASAVCLGFFRPFFFSIAQLPVVGQGILVIEASRSHSDTPHSVGFLSTSDQPVAETSP